MWTQMEVKCRTEAVLGLNKVKVTVSRDRGGKGVLVSVGSEGFLGIETSGWWIMN